MSEWMYNTPVGMPGSVITGGGAVRFNNPLDAKRSAWGDRIPSAEYPDGYLGTLSSRREDRLSATVKSRLTDRSYQRGVHKGERLDPKDYYWPPDFNPQSGLEREMTGQRWAPKGNPVEVLVNGGKPGPADMEAMKRQYGVTDQTAVLTVDPYRRAEMQRLLPNWR